MKERPILFSAPMVRAVLAGTKTQTRRIVKPQPNFDTARAALGHNVGDEHAGYDPMFSSIGLRDGRAWGYVQPNIRSPYGGPGDRLWVRETTRSHYMPNFLTGEPTNALCGKYAADGEPVLNEHEFDVAWWYSRKTCPAIHLPRWASRITLEVTGVRVERLQDISSGDAIAEGVNIHEDHHSKPRDNIYGPVQAYRDLWESINGLDSWDVNPWVWVIEFRKVAS